MIHWLFSTNKRMYESANLDSCEDKNHNQVIFFLLNEAKINQVSLSCLKT